jgi:putative ABC transport system permease protein
MQRVINEDDHEPLTAILPGVVLLEVWQMMSVVEKILMVVSGLVVAVGLFSMLIILMTSLNERRREMAILRSVGARPAHVFVLIMGEAVFLTLLAIGLGFAMVYGLMVLTQSWLESAFGLYVVISWPNSTELTLLMIIALCGFVVGLIPGIRIYRYSLADGMTIRI